MSDQAQSAAVVRCFLSREHRCGYFADRVARTRVLDPESPLLGAIYDQALAAGFRRSGPHLYRPQCPHCQACIPTRLVVDRFRPDRSQQRCKRRNADLQFDITPAGFDDELYRLYRRYLEARHAEGAENQGQPDDLRQLLTTPWTNTFLLRIFREGQLLACAITDRQASSLSAVYTFFDPDQASRGLGVFAILSQIEWARREQLPYLYLGFWIDRHPKMSYKSRFQPLQVFSDQRWQDQVAAPPGTPADV